MRILRFFRLFRAWRSFGSAVRLMRHPDVPLHLKVITGLLVLLILSPLNILGDIPFLGLFDDVALLALLAGWFTGAAARYAAAATIEGELVPTGGYSDSRTATARALDGTHPAAV
jgi:uncharacterized membrane protein YkvA (DUF1232 family)